MKKTIKKLVAQLLLPVLPTGPIVIIFGPMLEIDSPLFWGVVAWWYLFFAGTIAPGIWREE